MYCESILGKHRMAESSPVMPVWVLFIEQFSRLLQNFNVTGPSREKSSKRL